MLNLNKTQKRNAIIAASISVLITSIILNTTNAESSKSDTKSVAWYTANIKQAEAQNKLCRADSENTALHETENCVNALHALEISFGVKR